MMTRIRHTRRTGLTLTESLVALFVASIGLIGLMALFPLGALQMAQAIKDHRCTEAATRFDTMFRAEWDFSLENSNSTYFTVRNAMQHRVPANPTNSGNGQLRSYLGASRPVFVDPLGAAMTATLANIDPHCVGNRNPLTLPLAYNPTVPLPLPPTFTSPLKEDYVFRVGLDRLTTLQQRFTFCSLLDDVTYDETGRPLLEVGSTTIERGGRFSAVAVLQRMQPNILQLEFKILVFDGRAATYMPDSNEQRFGQKPDPMNPLPATVPLTLSTGQTQISIVYAGEPPSISKGRWIMLRTSGWSDIPNTNDAMGNPITPYWAAKAPVVSFARVVSVDAETPNLLTFEISTPITAIHDVSTFNVPVAPLPPGVTVPTPTHEVVVLAGLAEVFERPPLRMR
jgi:hypothetical protein